MNKSTLQQLTKIFEANPKIKLVYFFGSKTTGQDGPMSDYDFAVYLHEKDKKKMFDAQLGLIGKVTKVLKTDNVDIVILNTVEMPELKYNIIKDGKLIYEQEPFRVIVEPKILMEYFDFNIQLKKNGLLEA